MKPAFERAGGCWRSCAAAPSQPPRTMIEAMKSATPGNCKRLGELPTADWAFEAGVLVSPIARPILAHHIEVGVAGNFLSQEPERRFRASEAVGQRQMADEEPAFGESRCVDRKIADLPMHLTHRSLIDAHIISNMRIFVRGRVIAVFHVRHVDVDDAIEQSERFEAVVSARVVDKRKPQPTLRRNGYGRENLRHYMARGDQIDVMAAEGLQS